VRRPRFMTPSIVLRRVQAAAGGSLEPPLAWTLKEPDVSATVRAIDFCIVSPGVDASYSSGGTLMGMPNASCGEESAIDYDN
jgi:hypothetical protein